MAKLQSRKLGPHERDSHRRRLVDVLKRHGQKVHTVQLARGRSQAMWEPFLIFPDDDDGIDHEAFEPEDIARTVAVAAEHDAKQSGPGWYGVQLIDDRGEHLDAPVFFPVGLAGAATTTARDDTLLESCRFLQWQNREFANRHFKLFDKVEQVLELLVDAPLANAEVEKMRLDHELQEFKIEHETRRQATEHMWSKFGKFAKPIGKAVGEVFEDAAHNFDFGPTTGDDQADDDDDDEIQPREPLDRTAAPPGFPFRERAEAVLKPMSDDQRDRAGALLGPDLWKLFTGAAAAGTDLEAHELLRKMLTILADMQKGERDQLLNDLAVIVGFTAMPKIGELLRAAEK